MILWLALYIIPMLRIFSRWLPTPAVGGAGARVAGWIGRVEWGVAIMRDSVGLVAGILVGTIHGGQVLGLWRWAVSVPLVMVAGLAVMLSLLARWQHRQWRLRLIDSLVQHPAQHPQDFHDGYFQGLSGWRPDLTRVPARIVDAAHLDFRRHGRARQRCWPLLHAAASTVFYSSLVLLAARTAGYRERLQTIVDAIMRVWGARLLALAQVAVQVEGLERLQEINGTVIICSNHTSMLDFVATPVVLGCAHLARAPLHLRFLVARDHFLDNWLYYRVLRIGMAVEAAGMVCVHRHGTPEQRARAVPTAVRQMLHHHVDVAIYPQGTRTPARLDDHGRRTEPGYFTAGWPRRKRPVGQHMKKGAARLAYQAALQAAHAPKAGAVYVVPLGIRGAGVVLPKGARRLQTEGVVTLHIGEPLCVQVEEHNLDLHIGRLHEAIDQQLRILLDIDGKLLARFRYDVQQELGEEAAGQLLARLRQWEEGYQVSLAVLDLLSQLPATTRGERLRHLCDLVACTDHAGLLRLYDAL